MVELPSVSVFARPGGDALGGVSDWGNIIEADDKGCEVVERSCASSLADKTRSGGEDDDGPDTRLAPPAYVPVINGWGCSVI